MGLECSTRTIAENASGRDGQDISMRSRTFEALDPHTLDFSEAVGGRTDGILVEGCLIKGGGAAKVTWGYDICIAAPTDVVIRGNTLLRSW